MVRGSRFSFDYLSFKVEVMGSKIAVVAEQIIMWLRDLGFRDLGFSV